MSRYLLPAALCALTLISACEKPASSFPFGANPSAELADPASPFARLTPEQRAALTHYVSLTPEDRNCGHDGGAPALQNRPAQLVLDDARKTKACMDKIAAEKEAARLAAAYEAQKEKEREEKRAAAQQRKKAAAATLKSLKAKRDKMEGITWYSHRLDAPYSQRKVTLYFGEFSHGFGPLRLTISYVADSWLFIDKVWGRADGERVTLVDKLPRGEWDRDVGSGYIIETLDVALTSEQLEAIKKLANSQDSVLRFSGEKGVVDHQLSANNRKALREMIAAYDAVKYVTY